MPRAARKSQAGAAAEDNDDGDAAAAATVAAAVALPAAAVPAAADDAPRRSGRQRRPTTRALEGRATAAAAAAAAKARMDDDDDEEDDEDDDYYDDGSDHSLEDGEHAANPSRKRKAAAAASAAGDARGGGHRGKGKGRRASSSGSKGASTASAGSPDNTGASASSKTAAKTKRARTALATAAAAAVPDSDDTPSVANHVFSIQELAENIFSFLVEPQGRYTRGSHTLLYTPQAALRTLVACTRINRTCHSILASNLRLWRQLAESAFSIAPGQVVPLEDGMRLLGEVKCAPMRGEMSPDGTEVDVVRYIMLESMRFSFCKGCGQWTGLPLTRSLFFDAGGSKLPACRLCKPLEPAGRTVDSRTITKGSARGPPYRIPERHLRTMPCELVRNPHYRAAAPMHLYQITDVENKAIELAMAELEPSKVTLDHTKTLMASSPHLVARLALIAEYYKLRVLEGDADVDIQAVVIGDISGEKPAAGAANDDEDGDAAQKKKKKKRRSSAASKPRRPTDLTTAEGQDTMPDEDELIAAAEHLDAYGQWRPLLKSAASGKPAKPLGAAFRRKVVQFFDKVDEVRDAEAQFVEAFAAMGIPETALETVNFNTHIGFLRRRAQIRAGKAAGVAGKVLTWVETILGQHVAHALLTSSPSALKGNEIVRLLQQHEKEIVHEIDAEREYKRKLKRLSARPGGYDEDEDEEDMEEEDDDYDPSLDLPRAEASVLHVPYTPMRHALTDMAAGWIREANHRVAMVASQMHQTWKLQEAELAADKLRKFMHTVGVCPSSMRSANLRLFDSLPCNTLVEANASIERIPELFKDLIEARKIFKTIIDEAELTLTSFEKFDLNRLMFDADTPAQAEAVAKSFATRTKARMQADALRAEAKSILKAAQDEHGINGNHIYNRGLSRPWYEQMHTVKTPEAATALVESDLFKNVAKHCAGVGEFSAIVKTKNQESPLDWRDMRRLEEMRSSITDRDHGAELGNRFLALRAEREAAQAAFREAAKAYDKSLFREHPWYSYHYDKKDTNSWSSLVVDAGHGIMNDSDKEAALSALKTMAALREQAWAEMLAGAKERFGLESAEEINNMPNVELPLPLASKQRLWEVTDAASKTTAVNAFLALLAKHAPFFVEIKKGLASMSLAWSDLLPYFQVLIRRTPLAEVKAAVAALAPLHADAVLVEQAAKQRQQAINSAFGLGMDRHSVLVSARAVLAAWLDSRIPEDLPVLRTFRLVQPEELMNQMPTDVGPEAAVKAALDLPFLDNSTPDGMALDACLRAGLSAHAASEHWVMVGKKVVEAVIHGHGNYIFEVVTANPPISMAALCRRLEIFALWSPVQDLMDRLPGLVEDAPYANVSADDFFEEDHPLPTSPWCFYGDIRCRCRITCMGNASFDCTRGCTASGCAWLTTQQDRAPLPACPHHGQPAVTTKQ